MDLVIHGFAASTFTRTVRMVCEEREVPHILEPARLGTPEYGAIHPFQKMPAMRHGDRIVFESLAISVYIDGLGTGPRLLPSDPPRLVETLQWVSALSDAVYDGLVRSFIKLARRGGGREEIAAARDAARARLAPLDGALARSPYLAGDTVTLADLYLAPMLAYATSTPAGETLLGDLPQLERLFETMKQRESFRKTAP